MSDEETKDRGFKVTDRRSLQETKEEPEKPIAEKPEKADDKPRDEPRGPAAGPAPERPEGNERGDAADMPPLEPLNFSQFIMSLATSALIQMGDAQHPDAKGDELVDFGAARQTIDIIAMLKDKTKGNLDKNETRLLDNILTELRYRFVQKAGSKS